jgi:DNA-binding transcriptional LysR family regulator
MPLHAVRQDIASGALVLLSVEDQPSRGLTLPMSAIYPANSPPGPAGRWLIERLKERPAAEERAAGRGADCSRQDMV